mmetsp:Transcript_2511/g.3069  ORF Transcript_2511/g.3069 Transcript_2511/m.3069 type:complete len:308 (-) Transcript_2511:430-1353(-)
MAEEQELMHLARELSKTDDEERRLDIMSKISAIDITYEMLVSTKIGSVIKPFKKLPDEKLASAAGQLLKKWRAIADNYTAQPTKVAEVKKEKSIKTETKPIVSKPIDLPIQKVPISVTVDMKAEEYSSKLDSTRSGYREMLRSKLNDGNINKMPLHGIAEMIELAIHEWSCKQTGDASKSYAAKCRTLVFNLKKNEQLRSKVRSQEVLGDKLVLMNKDELADASVTKEREAMAEKLGAEVALDYAKRDDVVKKKWAACGITGHVNMFKCEKCGSRNLHHTERQTRSADEPMTQFFQCLECGNQWRMN